MQLRQDFPGDAALVMTKLQLNDTGRYRCEVVDGLEDKSTPVYLELRGTVCPPTLISCVVPNITQPTFNSIQRSILVIDFMKI